MRTTRNDESEDILGAHYAARRNNVDRLRRLIRRRDFDPNARSAENGRTPLHEACRYGADDAVAVLLSCKDVDLSLVDVDGNTPLHLAAGWGSETVVSLLLARAADAAIENARGFRPSQIAAQTGRRENAALLRRWIDDDDDEDDDAILTAVRREIPVEPTTVGPGPGVARTPDPLTRLRDALAIKERARGETHPSLGPTLRKLGDECRRLGRDEEAVEYFRRALDVAPPNDDDDERVLVNNLAEAYLRIDRPVDAERLLRRARTLVDESKDDDDVVASIVRRNLAIALIRSDAHAEAAALLDPARDDLALLGFARAGAGDHEGAVAAFERRLRDLNDDDDDDEERRLRTIEHLGRAHFAAGRPIEAERHFRRVFETLRERRGVDHPETRRAARNLAVVVASADRQSRNDSL